MNDSTFRKALEILYKHKNLNNFKITSFTIDRMDANPFYGDWKIHINVPATIKIEATITVDHTSWDEYLDVDYLFTERDLSDDGEVNKVIGDISKFDSDTKESLRLAYILFDGYNYAVKQIQHKDFHPRVVKVSARF